MDVLIIPCGIGLLWLSLKINKANLSFSSRYALTRIVGVVWIIYAGFLLLTLNRWGIVLP